MSLQRFILQLFLVAALAWAIGTYMDVTNPNVRIIAMMVGLYLGADLVAAAILWLRDHGPWREKGSGEGEAL